jgi:DNA-binding transcriptional ArsR family regulator
MVRAARVPSDVFAALADPTRWQVLSLLAARGAGSASSLAREMPVSRAAVIKHLTVLDRAGLVRARRQGREVLYVVQPQRLDATAQWLARLASEWDGRLDRIRRIAESQDPSSA